LAEGVVASTLGGTARLVGELVGGAEVVHVDVELPLIGPALRDDGDHALGGGDVICVYDRCRGGGGHAVVLALEVECLLFGGGFADPLLVAVIVQRDSAGRLRDGFRQVEGRVGNRRATRAGRLAPDGVIYEVVASRARDSMRVLRIMI